MIPSREIATRLLVRGTLRLTTPTHLGNGEASGLLDMPLLRDPAEGVPLLMGTSLAGALRNYLRSREQGYRGVEAAGGLAEQLFGGRKEDEMGEQSPLIVEDSRGTVASSEVRDGVKINSRTRLAEEKKKYDLELLPAGTEFPLRFELLLPADEAGARRLRMALALALHGLEQGEILIGARRTRGFGMCQVESWTVTEYDMQQSKDHKDLLAWLSRGRDWGYSQPTDQVGKAASVFNVTLPAVDARQAFHIEATFVVEGSLLVRSTHPLLLLDALTAGAQDVRQPDFTHLRSYRPDHQEVPSILPGTTLAGVLRSRATKILNTLAPTRRWAMIDSLFGPEMEPEEGSRPSQPAASRLVVEESVISPSNLLVQSRVALDRFTGGALDTALFSEAPQFGGQVTVRMTVQEPKPGEAGLLLLLLKDLWTGDLAVGGESSIGRGRLRGLSAHICHTGQPVGEWTLVLTDPGSGRLHISQGEVSSLNKLVKELTSVWEEA